MQRHASPVSTEGVVTPALDPTGPASAVDRKLDSEAGLYPSRRSLFGGLLGLSTFAAGVGTAASPAAAATRRYDLRNPEQLLEAFIKSTGDLSGKQVVLWGHGSAYAWLPRQGGFKLFDEDLFAVARYLPIPGGYQRLHKEAGLYLDQNTGKILERWYNPFIERDVDVIQLRNDPVNREHLVSQQGTVWGTEAWEQGEDVCFFRNVLIRREADMPVAQYRLYSPSDFHEFAELYKYFSDRSALEDTKTTSAPMVGCNTRVGGWLPWMEMGQREGMLLIHLRYKKLNDISELPRQTLSYFEKNAPDLLEAPTSVTGPNDTSWSYFKRIIDERRAGQGSGQQGR